jgi:hypothetical protein
VTVPTSPNTHVRITVLAPPAATGTLATNILLPSLPQMAASLKASTAEVTSAITVSLAVFGGIVRDADPAPEEAREGWLGALNVSSMALAIGA